MFRKFHFFLFIGLLSSIFCFTNTFADENGEPIDIGNIIAEGNFAFPTANGAAYIQGNAEYEKIPDAIISDPDFEKMRDLPTDSQDYILGTKVGWFVIPQRDNPDRVWICTGFLVGPDLFMTNHHCVHDDFGPLPLEDARIYMDYYQDRDVDPTRGGVTAGVAAVLRADDLKDYALLRLDKPIGDTYGWLELDTTTVPNSSQSVKIIQHPRGRSKEIVRRNSQIIDLPIGHPLFGVPYAISYLADTEAGSSGSPVFLRDGTGVIAIHHSGFTIRSTGAGFNNSGSLMSHIVPEIQQYLPQTSGTITFSPNEIPDQTFTVGTPINPFYLPLATGGTVPYTYTLEPLPAGLSFDAAIQVLSGTPTTAATATPITYTATDATGASATLNFNIEVIGDGPVPRTVDVNADGKVTVVDLAIVALFYGTQVPAGLSLPADVNADGIVNILDLTAVAQGIDAAGNSDTFSTDDVAAVLEAIAGIEAIPEAPAHFSTSQQAGFAGIAYRNVGAAFADAKHFATDDVRLGKWMPMLKELLHRLAEMQEIPDTTALLPNYPNPFNPETWIPYHLSKETEVTLTIYDVSGIAVRALTLGHQAAGVYESRARAAYWDGRNQIGEPVASGLYFYTLTAGEFTATRKLLIIK